MVKITIPPIGQKLVDDAGSMVKEWYDKLKFIERLQPLSDITFPSVTPTTIDGAGPGAFTLNYPLTRSTLALGATLTSLTSSLGSDVNLSNIANFFDGPSVAQGTSGTWFVSGGVVIFGPADTFVAKLWDGTTVIDSKEVTYPATSFLSISLSGVITSPAGNLRISVRALNTTTANIKFNATGLSKDSTITAVRIA